MQDTILTVSNLTKTFDGLKAVDDFSLSLARGTIVGLIGPNGAGKTTIFNIITGFLPADRGEIFNDGKNIVGLRPHQIARGGIARTFQDLRLITEITVIENVLLARPKQSGEHFISVMFKPGRIQQEEQQNQKNALELLKFVGLAEKGQHLAQALSYGQQKLLALACCLATEANLLLLDEPVAGIHPEMIEKMLSLIRELASRGKTILFIEHNIEAVMQVADLVIVMDAGRKIVEGPPEVIQNNTEILEAYLE